MKMFTPFRIVRLPLRGHFSGIRGSICQRFSRAGAEILFACRQLRGSAQQCMLAAAFVAAGVSAASAAEPFAHWKLDGSLNDSGPAGLRMSLLGQPVVSTTDAVSGQSYLLDQSSQTQGMVARLGDFSQATDFTFTVWVQFAKMEGGFTETAPHNIARFWGRNASGQADVLDLRVRDGALDVYYTNPARNLFADNLSVPVGKWAFVAVSLKGNTLTVTLDDKSRSFPVSGPQSYQTLTIGTVSAGSRRGMTGWVDEVNLYREALGAAQLAEIYRKEKGSR